MSDTIVSAIVPDLFPLNEHLVLDQLELRGQMNTSDEAVAEQIRQSIRRQHPQLFAQPQQTDRICLLGGGPSLNDTVDELDALLREGAKLITTNGAYAWALEHHLLPSAHIVMDAREVTAAFVDPPLPRCQYLVASQCHPAVWDRLEGRPHVWIWHSLTGACDQAKILDEFYGERRWVGTGGGTTVVMRSLSLLKTLGYTRIDLFGVDSCWLRGQHHAFPQEANKHERAIHVKAAPVDRPDLERHYWCAPWHIAQVSDFVGLITVHPPPLLVTVHGDGLLAHVVHSCAAITVVEDAPTLAEAESVTVKEV